MIKRPSVLTIILSLLILLLSGCSAQKSNATEVSSNPANQPTVTSDNVQESEELILLKSVTETIHPSLPEFIFNIYGQQKKDEYYSFVHKIIVKRVDKPNEVLQEIIFTRSNDSWHNYPVIAEKSGLIIEDMDFDGYKDFRLQKYPGKRIPYFYWLWDKDTSTFIQNKELECIFTTKVDNASRSIISDASGNAFTSFRYFYKYFDGHIKLVKEIRVEYKKEKTGEMIAHITILEPKDNEMVVVAEYDRDGNTKLDELE